MVGTVQAAQLQAVSQQVVAAGVGVGTEDMDEVTMMALLARLEANITANIASKIDASLAPIAGRVETVEKAVESVETAVSSVTATVTDMAQCVQNMESSLRSVIDDVHRLKESSVAPQTFATAMALGAPSGDPGLQGEVSRPRPNLRGPVRSKPPTPELREVLERSSRTLSLYPVERVLLDEARDKLEEEGFDGDAWSEALHRVAWEFLHFEMKLSSDEWKQLTINDIFVPKRLEAATLYVEFATLRQADAVKSLAVHLRPGQRLRVSRHTPWQARERVNMLEAHAKSLRDQGNKTRLDIRESDYLLQFKPRADPSATWSSFMDMGSLPPFDLTNSAISSKSPGEAQGRKVRPGILPGGPEVRKRKANSPATGANTQPLGRKSCRQEEDSDDSLPAGPPVPITAQNIQEEIADAEEGEIFVSGDDALARIREAQASIGRLSLTLDHKTTTTRLRSGK